MAYMKYKYQHKGLNQIYQSAKVPQNSFSTKNMLVTKTIAELENELVK